MVEGWLCCMVLLSTTLMYLSLPSMMPMFSPYLLDRIDLVIVCNEGQTSVSR